jgi:hypothetical protein
LHFLHLLNQKKLSWRTLEALRKVSIIKKSFQKSSLLFFNPRNYKINKIKTKSSVVVEKELIEIL